MNKNLLKRIVAIFSCVSICIVSMISTVPVYAMEDVTNYSKIQTYASNGYADIPTYVTIPYGVTYHIFDGNPNDYIDRFDYTFENQKTLGTVSLANDARIHRFKIKLWFINATTDRGPAGSKVKLTLRITRGNGTSKTVVIEQGEAWGYYESEWFENAYAGERITLWADASTGTGQASNGNFRSLKFIDFQMYCD